MIELIGAAPGPLEHALKARRRIEDLFREPLHAAQAAGLVRPELTPPDVRILLTMLPSLARKNAGATDWTRARELAQLTLASPQCNDAALPPPRQPTPQPTT